MMSYKSLQEVMAITVNWERKLDDLYEVALIGVKNEESKKLVSFLVERQKANLEVLEGIDVKKYGPDEWIQFAGGGYSEKDLIPDHEIHRDSTPEQIFDAILQYELKLEKFYGMISEHVASDTQRDLFGSLRTFKAGQTERIENFVRAN